MTRYYVGLDVHSKQSVFVIQRAKGTLVAQGEVSTTPEGLGRLRTEHRLPEGTPMALETGTVAFFVARQLAARALKPYQQPGELSQ